MTLRALALFAVTAALTSAPLHARSLHQSKPLSFEELPEICQSHFTRAQACYQKAGKAAEFHKGNTDFLRQSLPAATAEQRERMCKIAEEAFAEKAAQLKCE
ncbi:hypothetical protein [Neisseria animalis]|uniref:DUF5339 domain-containing protein n=1 Tax=Neisseria animalis TaxID=492 RepID=A0A5P3MNZ0_NEIAN|nr:hypothetical protein [Neisseria animalis]QEY23257.1 hypothetical protein D0T90_00985 [Neisseria animalis]ROW31987.1 hypothetical protein CGZ60_07430 [Neisseria animalis]VEE08529.1 putative phage associated membrane protein [Neisseria animalis]